MPNKDFYLEFPDNVRKFLNEQTVYGDLQARMGFETDVYAYLKNKNLPFDDKSVGIATIRRVINSYLERNRILAQRIQKLGELCARPESMAKYH